ncbi:PIG-L family deacetylase [Marinoscillum sp. MHG1-6]|uniref:PIG-L family deacetylase n=1 Tax=Marinoscillum sp. MHG1-6 TaxID=2959627 RepID=UPI0021579B7B|nr:PIG-L family deacetylase [Marinoscillum sp. MHG1-6]
MMTFIRSIILILVTYGLAAASTPERYHSGKILQMLEKFNTLGSVLYVAAHPDDENTQLISYLANGMNLRAGYLAATRGDGGQNLVGTEIRESLGIIRTQELLAARRIDGGEQFFSRANDFGYSKDPEETFDKWDREQVLADFVWVLRKFRPDVIVTRFSTTPKVTHGHHTASAVLAKEAFGLSGDKNAYPEQLDYVSVWQPTRLFWNTNTWFFRSDPNKFNPDKYVKVDVGGYDPALGESYTEIAARSRSMHKSQGFGRSGSRGSEYEYLEQWEGEAVKDVFEGLDFTWKRVNAEEIGEMVNEAIMYFNPSEPESILPDLIEIRKRVEDLKDDFWREVKLKEIDQLILAVTGTYIEFVSDASQYSPGDTMSVNLEIINRSKAPVVLSGVSFSKWSNNYIYNLKLANNQLNELSYELPFSHSVPISNPYWLKEAGKEGMYNVEDQRLISTPENGPVVTAKVILRIKDQFLECEVPVVYKTTDRVKGEIYKPVSITPKVMVNISQKALVYVDDEPKKVQVTIIGGAPYAQGQLKLNLPNGWNAEPSVQDFVITRKGEEQVFDFMVTPSKETGEYKIGAIAILGNQEFNRGRVMISYDHIPEQVWFPKSETKAVRLNLKKSGNLIGYIMGAGDEVPYSLGQMGYQTQLLDKETVTAQNLQQYDAVIVGIRAFNTLDWLAFKNKELFEYTKNGGTVIVQYNTYGTVTEELAPYPIKISRDRVAVEQAEVKILDKKAAVLNYPNQLEKSDFDNWVQERGLYFPNEWSKEFTPVLSMNDPGESAKEGSLLIAQYGKGYYIYTGISFFRELPAGVPGAFRLLANLISIGKTDKEN